MLMILPLPCLPSLYTMLWQELFKHHVCPASSMCLTKLSGPGKVLEGAAVSIMFVTNKSPETSRITFYTSLADDAA